MANNALKERIGLYQENRFLIMLIALFGLMLLQPLISYFVDIRFLSNLFLSLIFLSGIFAISIKKHHPIIAMLISLPFLILMWLSEFVDIGGYENIKSFFGMLFLLHMIILLLNHIFRQDEVTKEVIFGALVVYLLMGLMWSFGYDLVDSLIPGSFKYPENFSKLNNSFAYFSFVTLTTLGYGDITPVSPPAAAMAITQAITGQIYLTVLIAQLMGIKIAQQMRKKN